MQHVSNAMFYKLFIKCTSLQIPIPPTDVKHSTVNVRWICVYRYIYSLFYQWESVQPVCVQCGLYESEWVCIQHYMYLIESESKQSSQSWVCEAQHGGQPHMHSCVAIWTAPWISTGLQHTITQWANISQIREKDLLKKVPHPIKHTGDGRGRRHMTHSYEHCCSNPVLTKKALAFCY